LLQGLSPGLDFFFNLLKAVLAEKHLVNNMKTQTVGVMSRDGSFLELRDVTYAPGPGGPVKNR
jgi:hypothetical protein